jgi:hypothetical protein
MSSVGQAVIDLVEGVWRVPDLEVDSFVHEVRIFDRHLPACGKVEQSEAIFICTLMQTVLAYRWLMYGFLEIYSKVIIRCGVLSEIQLQI